jgi:chorismate dehydratase
MMRLGHIEYSNCLPVHARLIAEAPPAGVSIVTAIPSLLNAALARADIDVAPCSSIELARHPGAYRVLPDLVIGSDGPVQSILLESTVALEALDDSPVAIPTASATSVVLLRVLLERRYRVRPRYVWYDQSDAADPVEAGAAAVLRIGDVALRRAAPPDRAVHDLGELWTAWTSLPFAFAVWQARAEVDGSPGLARLHAALLDSRHWFEQHAEQVACSFAGTFALPPERLLGYWRSLRYELDARMQQGLLRYYALAAELDEAAPVGALPWADVTGG